MRSNLRYSYEQNLLLCDFVVDEEQVGTKKSMEEVKLMIRRNCNRDQYISAVQIRSLFPSFARILRRGKLKPPTQ